MGLKLCRSVDGERPDPDVVEGERTRRIDMAIELTLLERNLAGL